MSDEARPRVEECERQLAAASGAAARATAAARLARLLVDEDSDRAEGLARQALADAQEAGDDHVRCLAGLTLGTCALWRGDVGSARAELERALDAADKAGSIALAGQAQDWLGVVAARAGDVAGALRHHADALRIAQALGEEGMQAKILNNLAIAHLANGDHDAAIDCQVRSLRLKQAVGDRRGEAITLANLGCAYRQVRENEAALECFRRSHALLSEMASPQFEAMAAANLADTLTELGRLAEAADMMAVAEAGAERIGVEGMRPAISVMRARLLTRQGDAPAAIRLLRDWMPRLEAVGEPRLHAEAALALAVARMHAADGGAGETAREALERAVTLGDHELESEAHLVLADLCEREGDAAGALAHLRRRLALREADERRRGERIAERFRLRLETEALREHAASLENMIFVDALTGLPNRRMLDRRVEAEWSRSRRDGTSLAIAVADLDHFKSVNDSHGHAVGDAVLREAGRAMAAELADDALVARTGGEEFVLLLPGADEAGAASACERARAAVERVRWDDLAAGLRVTTSIGWAADRRAATPGDLLSAADAALYRAKASGRNQVHGGAALARGPAA